MNCVIFDMDGVIFDSEKLVIDCWEILAKRDGIPDIKEICYRCLGTNSEQTRRIMLQHYGEDFPYDDYQAELHKLFHEKADGGKLLQKPGIKELLEFLKHQGIRMAVASSTKSITVKRELEEGGLLSYFDEIIGGEMVKKSKPEPDIFLLACQKLGAKACSAYVIEDSYNGIRAAFAAGIRAIMVPDLIAPDQEMEQKATVILPSLFEVIDYFERHQESGLDK